MTVPDDPSPNATLEQYKAALLSVRNRMTDIHLGLIQAHCRAPNHTVTATQLATTTGLKNYGAANLHYGTFAHWIADALDFVPDQRPDQSYRWWRALASGHAGSEETHKGHFEWVMRPALVEALQSMKWA